MKKSQVEVLEWVQSQQWYQTIELSGGIITPGNVDSRTRYPFLENISFSGKRVLDVGCNSGAYCFYAKRNGASEVTGVDINDRRLKQARAIAEIENLDVTFLQRGIDEIEDLGKFDIVFCFAVMTEIPNLLGSIQALSHAIGDVALVELGIADPLLYISKSRRFHRNWLKRVRLRKNVLELRKHKHGWQIDPSLKVVKTVFGEEFQIDNLGPGPRYNMLRVTRLSQ